MEEKYIIIGANNPAVFIGVMHSLHISPEAGMKGGLDRNTLEQVHEKALEKRIAIIAVKLEDLQKVSNKDNLFTFVSMTGDKSLEYGVLMPKLLDLKEGKPERSSEIDENDQEHLHSLLESDVDFDTFMKLI